MAWLIVTQNISWVTSFNFMALLSLTKPNSPNTVPKLKSRNRIMMAGADPGGS